MFDQISALSISDSTEIPCHINERKIVSRESLNKILLCDYLQAKILYFDKGKHENFCQFGGVNQHLFRKIITKAQS